MGAFRSRNQQAVMDYDLLPPEPATRQERRRQKRPDIVDAEFVTVREPPRRAFEARFQNDNWRMKMRPAGQGGVADIVSRLSVRMHALVNRCEKVLMRLSSDFFSAVVALVFVLVFGMSGGFSLITGAQSGAEASVSPLDITHVSLTPQDADGMRVLLVTGIVENRSAGLVEVPRIRADFISNGRFVASAVIEPPVPEIKAGNSHGFSAKLQYPGGKMPEMRLSFIGTDVSGP